MCLYLLVCLMTFSIIKGSTIFKKCIFRRITPTYNLYLGFSQKSVELCEIICRGRFVVKRTRRVGGGRPRDAQHTLGCDILRVMLV